MECYAVTNNEAKRSILDVWQASEYVYDPNTDMGKNDLKNKIM